MSLLDVPIGPNAPHEVNVVIEIPKFSTNKYELDPDLGVMRLDRVLYSPLFYPVDYGYIPQTKYLDGDPVDVLVLIVHPTYPGVVVEAKPVGVLRMVDSGLPDEKILCVATKDPRFRTREGLADINPHTLDEIVHFFEVYKHLENKSVEVEGWEGPEKAREIIQKFRLDK
ncbi:MAG: inorganic diphosphatase [Fimbriimonadaceae bacterium]|nr:inorganic diphosphatase [Fimbriimonadaceae bacterium]